MFSFSLLNFPFCWNLYCAVPNFMGGYNSFHTKALRTEASKMIHFPSGRTWFCLWTGFDQWVLLPSQCHRPVFHTATLKHELKTKPRNAPASLSTRLCCYAYYYQSCQQKYENCNELGGMCTANGQDQTRTMLRWLLRIVNRVTLGPNHASSRG